MKLNYREEGSGEALIILHGLFGSLDNWQTMANTLAENFRVFIVDQRNHGRSPHSDDWSYEAMSKDILELMDDIGLEQAHVLGHSMGGKTAMQLAFRHSKRLSSLLVVDIAPKKYPLHHDHVLEALYAVDLQHTRSRKEAEEKMTVLKDSATRQFLLKNLYWDDADKLAWRFNLEVISKNIGRVGEATLPDKNMDNQLLNKLPVLFIRGENSAYIADADMELAKSVFPLAQLNTIPGAGHWIHADQPLLFAQTVKKFIEELP